MRLSLMGSIPKFDPRIIIFTADGTFDKTLYPDYTNFDAIVIGGGGGRGGGFYGTDTEHSDQTLRNYGGAGGGGGFHRVQGLLEALEDYLDVYVGSAGSDGSDKSDDLDDLSDGDYGGTSYFGSYVLASGGNGGLRSLSSSYDIATEGDGGDGGLGGQSENGWGGKGGAAGIKDDPETFGDKPGTNGENGTLQIGPYEFTEDSFTLSGLIGKGGGGGAGGGAKLIDGDTDWIPQFPFPTSGGRGSYNSDDLVSGLAGAPFVDPDFGVVIGPGSGGGARVTPLTRSWTSYGNAGKPGIVVVRLTKE